MPLASVHRLVGVVAARPPRCPVLPD
jgi:hypothetical protein